MGVSANLRLPRGARAGLNLDTGRTVSDNCFTTPPDNPGQKTYDLLASTVSYCRSVTPFTGNLSIRLNGSVPLPYRFTVSGNYQNGSGAQRTAIWNAPNSANRAFPSSRATLCVRCADGDGMHLDGGDPVDQAWHGVRGTA